MDARLGRALHYRLVRALVTSVAALVAALFIGALANAAHVAEVPSLSTDVYDVAHPDGSMAYTAHERGPPALSAGTPDTAVDRHTVGASARPSDSETTAYDFFFPGTLAQVGRATTATGAQVGLTNEGLYPFQRWRVAANNVGKGVDTFYPASNGFFGAADEMHIQPGQLIDRYGGSGYSRFFSPKGTPAEMRALPPGVGDQPLRTFEVMKPFPVQSGTVAPAFGQLGLGTQHLAPVRLEVLLRRGILREVG